MDDDVNQNYQNDVYDEHMSTSSRHYYPLSLRNSSTQDLFREESNLLLEGFLSGTEQTYETHWDIRLVNPIVEN